MKTSIFYKNRAKYSLYLLILNLVFVTACSVGGKSSDIVPSNAAGTGGSMARFTIAQNNLYIVTNTALKTVSLADVQNLKISNSVTLPGLNGSIVETIFPFKDHLLIGTQTGMYVYEISVPNKPNFVSMYAHVRSCDPVVAQGNYAYVTLRSGTNCRFSTTNQLDVLDISNLSNLKVMKSFPMENPHGLGVDGNLLFVCEGDKGLKVFDCSVPVDLKLIQEIKDVNTYDVIPKDKVLIVTGKTGVLQYSYQNSSKLQLLSHLKIG